MSSGCCFEDASVGDELLDEVVTPLLISRLLTLISFIIFEVIFTRIWPPCMIAHYEYSAPLMGRRLRSGCGSKTGMHSNWRTSIGQPHHNCQDYLSNNPEIEYGCSLAFSTYANVNMGRERGRWHQRPGGGGNGFGRWEATTVISTFKTPPPGP